MIKLSHISKEFVSGKRTVHAVQDVSLTIDKGEVFGMIGFSGAGKSTLVRCINLLERPTSGKVIVDGQDMLSLSAKELRQARKKIGMIFQHFNLMPSRTVAGNVAYPLRGSGLSKQQIEEKVQRLLDLVGIGDKAEAYPKQDVYKRQAHRLHPSQSEERSNGCSGFPRPRCTAVRGYPLHCAGCAAVHQAAAQNGRGCARF